MKRAVDSRCVPNLQCEYAGADRCGVADTFTETLPIFHTCGSSGYLGRDTLRDELFRARRTDGRRCEVRSARDAVARAS